MINLYIKCFLSRIFKNFPFLNPIWNKYLRYDNNKYYERLSGYVIVPFGDYCLPRTITTINRLKPTKEFGELTFPFDLCFSKFESNLKLLQNNFDDFFDDLLFDENNCYWINEKYNLVFNHDNMPLNEFCDRYKNRIENLFNIIKSKDKHVFFICASFSPISKNSIKCFYNEIIKYRDKESFTIILINQSENKIIMDEEYFYCINLVGDKSFSKINTKGVWVKELKRLRKINAIIFNQKVISELVSIIKKSGFNI